MTAASASAAHATFVIDRLLAAPPAAVWRALTDRETKARWFSPAQTYDFRVGGGEASGGEHDGKTYAFRSRFEDIVPNERLVFTYDMLMEGRRISVSLTTIELKPDGAGTRLTLTEQGVFLDGLDQPAIREGGTRQMIDGLAALVEQLAAA